MQERRTYDQDRRPLYEQVTEKFRTLIYQGALPADSRLPSVQEKYKEDFRSEFLELVKRGCRSGFEEKELLTLVQRGYKEEQK